MDISFLASPIDRSELAWADPATLVDAAGNKFSVVNAIPRFVNSQNYSASFGFQWNQFQTLQIDRFNGTAITSSRFYRSSGWRKEDLRGQRILEVGCGAGRFTQIALEAGAHVYSVDLSDAVEVNMRNNGPHPRLQIHQADIYNLPFKYEYFDKIFCFGVLQHTPNVKCAFMSLMPFLKRHGEVAVDIYAKTWKTYFLTKYWWRPLTKRLDKEVLLKSLRTIIPLWFPISCVLYRIPRPFGAWLSQAIPIANYINDFPAMPKKELQEWAILDTFDMLSAEYDSPQSLGTLRGWMEEAQLEVIYCGPGDNGYVGVGRKR